MRKLSQRLISAVAALLSGGEDIAPQTSAAQDVKPRTYNRREVVLPSGRFAAMSPILWLDVIVSENPNVLMKFSVLASRCVAIDGEPLTLEEVFQLEARDFYPIFSMLHAETINVGQFAKGVT